MVKASVPYSGILLILCVPLLIMPSNRAIIPPLFSIGDADIQSYDVILVLVGCKVVTSIFLGRGRLYISTSHSAIIIFLFILFEATLVAYYQFGREIFIREMVTFIRFLTEVSVFFFLALLIKSERLVKILEKVIEWMGYAIGGTFYLSLVLVHGIKF